jgi:ribosomal protein L24
LVAKGNIKGRVAELQDAAAAKTQITIESLIKEAADIQKRATKAGQHSAAIAALVAKAKLAGRWVERAEQKNTNVNYIVSDQPMTEEEWVAEHVTEH